MQIESCFSENASRHVANDDWNQLLTRLSPYNGDRNEVGPLVKSKWGQSKSNDNIDTIAYNDFAPDSNCTIGGHCPAGCVAVAMAQVMRYWNYPFFMTSEGTMFNWCNMPDKLITTSDCYEESKAAINALLQDCGRTVHMSYTCSGSSATLYDAEYALREIYYYSSIMDIACSTQNLTNELLQRIGNELDNGHPVIMRATDLGSGAGHAFICDGYKNRKLYMNWGWNGQYDGLFVYGNLCPSVYHFNTGYGALYKIMPDITLASHFDTLYLSNYYSVIYNYIPQLPFYKIAPSVADVLVSAGSNTPEPFHIIPTGASTIYQAHEEIILKDGFTAERGCDFTARIEPCSPCDDRGYTESDMSEDIAMVPGHASEDQHASFHAAAQSLPELYPNPTDKLLTVMTEKIPQSATIMDIAGRPVGGWRFVSITDSKLELDVSALPDGVYLITLLYDTGVVASHRFVKKQ